MATAKTKILYLITKSNWGGAQRYVYDLATNLPQEEYEVVVVAGGHGDLIEKLTAANIRVVPIPSLQRDLSASQEFKSLREIWHIILTENPDILHLNSSKAGALGALIGRIARIPKIIFTAHGWAFNEDRPGWQKLMAKTIHWITVLLSHQTIAVSHEVKRQMAWPGVKQKMTVIHNGRTITHFYDRDQARHFLSTREPRLAPYKDDFWSITIAELHPVKRHEAVIETFKKLIETEPHTRHLIIGGGEQAEYLKSKIKELDLTDQVFLLGAVPEAAEYLKAADMFILASRSEAMAYVIVEAASAGLPIVATRVGGIPEIIEDENSGLLSSPLDNKALFEAILSLRRDADLRARLGQKARECSSEFTLQNMLQETLKTYRA